MQPIFTALVGVAAMLALMRAADAAIIAQSSGGGSLGTAPVSWRDVFTTGSNASEILQFDDDQDTSPSRPVHFEEPNYVFGGMATPAISMFTMSHPVFTWGMSETEFGREHHQLVGALVGDTSMSMFDSITFRAKSIDDLNFDGPFPENKAANGDFDTSSSFLAFFGLDGMASISAPEPSVFFLVGMCTGIMGLLIYGRRFQRERRYYRSRYHQLLR